MSDAERDDKTEEPSLQRLDQLRKDGDVAMSKDIVSGLAFVAGALAIISAAPTVTTQLIGLVRTSMSQAGRLPKTAKDGLSDLLDAALMPMGLTFVAVLAAGAMAFFATAAQTQMGFWPEKLKPDPKKMFQVQRLTKVFKREFVTDLLLAFLKAFALLGLVLFSVGDTWRTWPGQLFAPVEHGPAAWSALLAGVLRGAAVALVAIGGIDYFVQHRRYMDKARMTKEELKREHKDNEGDPLIKSQRKRKHREMSQGRIAEDVPGADVVVVNPTHIAIAIRYRAGVDRAPTVVCKGKDHRADQIRATAREHGVPIVKDIPLARLLFKQVKVGRAVPEESYRAVAAVLAFVYRTTGRRPQ